MMFYSNLHTLHLFYLSGLHHSPISSIVHHEIEANCDVYVDSVIDEMIQKPITSVE